MKIKLSKLSKILAATALTSLCMTSLALGGTYKIGAVFSVTGGASFLGEPEKKTAEMMVEQINEQGGINGNKVELIVYDSQGDATKARYAVKKLMSREKVVAVIGPSTSGNSIAVGPLAKQYKTPLVSCAASYKITTKNRDTGEQYKWVFKTPHTDTMAAEAIFTHMNKTGMSKAAIITSTSGFGASGRGELLRLASKFGIKIVADEKYGPKDTDMTAQLTKIKSLGPEALINWSIGPAQVTVVRNWKDLNMTGIKLYQSHGFGSLKNVELAAGAAEGVFVPLSSIVVADLLPADHYQKQVTTDYKKAYESKYNEAISAFGGHAWDALALVFDALKTVGPDKSKIRDHIENRKNFIGQHGMFNFSKTDHNGLSKDAFNILVVKNNTWAFAP